MTGLDISPSISSLPGSKSTTRVSTDDASGSTSMAANIQEPLEVGCKLLLIDEDSSATNLLVKDRRMQRLIRNEPIVPLVSRVRAHYREQGVSTITVVGGLGDWLTVAEHVIAMDSYMPRLITEEAKRVTETYPGHVLQHSDYDLVRCRDMGINLTGGRPPYATSKAFVSIKPTVNNPVHDPSEAPTGIDLSGLD